MSGRKTTTRARNESGYADADCGAGESGCADESDGAGVSGCADADYGTGTNEDPDRKCPRGEEA